MLRSSGIEDAVRFAEVKAGENDFRAIEMLRLVFRPIRDGDAVAQNAFVTLVDKPVVSVISHVKPWDRAKFITHACLSLGRYQCENDLFVRAISSRLFTRPVC